MSLVQELGAQLRAASDELPTAELSIAIQRLRGASDALMWVRQTSVDPIGVPQLGNAVEHAERAVAALRIAQDEIAHYLTAVGLVPDAQSSPERDRRPGPVRDDRPPPTRAPARDTAPRLGRGAVTPPAQQLGPWWRARVAQLTGEPAPVDATAAGSGDPAELLRRIAAGVRSGDRSRLSRDLHAVDVSIGLALSAVSRPVLHRLAVDLLGHQPRPDDLPRLRDAAAGRVRALLPGIAPALVDTLLARVCRTPSASGAPDGSGQPGDTDRTSSTDQPRGTDQPDEPAETHQPDELGEPDELDHPADSAVTASVLTGILLARLGRDVTTLDPDAPQAPPRRDSHA